MSDNEIPVDKLVRVYRKMRAAEQELTREFESKLEAIKQQREEVSRLLKDRILALGDGITSLKTADGTVILGTKTRYYAQDWDALKRFIIENEALELLEKRVAQKNMAQFIEENPDKQPPGLNVITEYDVSVRAPSAS